MARSMTRIPSGRSVLAAVVIAVVGFALVQVFGNVVDVQHASTSESFGDAAADAGNRLRLALLFDAVVFVPGYLLMARLWSKWRMHSLHSFGTAVPPAGASRSAAFASRLYRPVPLLIAVAAASDLLENSFVYIGLGTVDLGDAAAASMVAPASALLVLLRIATVSKWVAGALALLALIAAGISELRARRRR